jgi:2-oxoglutarate dehydrogenase E2 component (dihydrolipoamide succinyltransferase)
MADVRLPRLADTLVEGTVSRWLKRPGERVAQGEPLVEVETDKVNSELESPYDGLLAEILAPEGTTVPVGEVIARIDQGAEGDQATSRAEAVRVGETGEAVGPVGPGEPPEQAHAQEVSGLDPLRRRIAERMQEARATVDQGSCSVQVDLSGARAQGGWTARFLRAAARAGGYANVGLAVEVPGGLVVPVVREAGRKSLPELSQAVGDLAQRARENKLDPGEASGGEFTVTNVGSVGTVLAFPLVNPGQPAILAPGAVVDGRCWVTLCYDRSALAPEEAEALLERVAVELREDSAERVTTQTPAITGTDFETDP